MELDFSKREKIAGLFIISVVVLLLIAVITIAHGKNWFKAYTTYYTVFDEGYNLHQNAAVKLFGATIGRVVNIAPVEDRVRVELAILERYAHRIRDDSVAIVESPTFIGDEYISIKPGDTDAPLIPEDGEIPSMPRKSLADILAEFQVEKTAKMIIKALQDVSEMAQIMRDPDGPLFATVDNVNRTLAHLEKIVWDIQAGKGTIGGLLKSRELLETTLDNLDRAGVILENIDKASEKMPDVMNQAQHNMGEVEASLVTLRTILANIEKGSHDIPEVVQTAKEGVVEIRESAKSADRVFQSLQKNPVIRWNLPPEPEGKTIDTMLRQ